MLPEKIMQSDMLDILFENKNKTYGAYALRKTYNKRMASAITTTLFVAVAFSVFQFVHHAKDKDRVVTFIIPDGPTLAKLPDDPKPLPKVEQPKQAAASHVNTVNNSAPIIVKDDVKTDMPTVDDLAKNMIGDKNIIGDDNIDVIQPPASDHASEGVIAPKPVEAKVDNSPLVTAEVMPQYPGGIEALKKFMLKNLRQPDDLQAGEKIVVRALFVVNKSGQIEAVKIVNSGRADLDKEVMRVINKMPLWKPGMQNGTAVSVYFNLPVTFMTEE